MKIGVPREVMHGEGRVALVPEDCRRLVDAGHSVFMQKQAAVASGYGDTDYERVGVVILDSAQVLYEHAQLIVKVKQPLEQDLQYLEEHHTVFSYLHLAADKPLVEKLCQIGLTAIPFEAVTGASGDHPLLAPMSAVAGRLSVIRGARLLFSIYGGRGTLLGGVDGADVGRVVVLGAGVAGSHAVSTALGLNAEVHVFDLLPGRLSELKNRYPALETHLSQPDAIAGVCETADLVVGAVMVAGRRAPTVLTGEMKASMPEGSVIVDIAIDQGGCVENIRVTSSDELAYKEQGVIHSAVPNMPGAVPRTASQSLSSVVAPYVLQLANGGLSEEVLLRAIAVRDGQVVDEVLREELDITVINA